MQLDPTWMFYILFAFAMVLMEGIAIAYILFKLSVLQNSMIVMEQRMVKVETILEERKM